MCSFTLSITCGINSKMFLRFLVLLGAKIADDIIEVVVITLPYHFLVNFSVPSLKMRYFSLALSE